MTENNTVKLLFTPERLPALVCYCPGRLLDEGKLFLRKLIVLGEKDCSWCERHLGCRLERRLYKVGFYCSGWWLSKVLRRELLL